MVFYLNPFSNLQKVLTAFLKEAEELKTEVGTLAFSLYASVVEFKQQHYAGQPAAKTAEVMGLMHALFVVAYFDRRQLY